jgi:hypothetical protein
VLKGDQEMTIPTTCKDFVSHPHIVETKRIFKDKNGNTIEDVKMRGCYTCQCASASEEQGTSQIAEELNALGIPADVHQTGGFTMCVYIKTSDTSYIYANQEGFGMYENDEDYEGENVFFGDDFKEQTAKSKAERIIQTMKEKNLTAKEIN